MSEDILVNISPQETRVALMQQGVVQELHIERSYHPQVSESHPPVLSQEEVPRVRVRVEEAVHKYLVRISSKICSAGLSGRSFPCGLAG